MVHERCAKKSFRDSLEDIKERMKEKRNKQLTKVATANKNLSTKVKGKILQNSCVMLKNVQVNNKALAQALEFEKAKRRQAEDVILHLKRDYQALKFQVFMLQRKLKSQEEEKSTESKLSALREIISKVTANLLETADLLRPAYDLCFTNSSQRFNPPILEERNVTNSTAALCVPIIEDNTENKIPENEMDNFTALKNPDLLNENSRQNSERFISVQRGSRGRRAVIHHELLVSQNEDGKGSELAQNVSVRHSNYSFKQHDEPCIFNSVESSTAADFAKDVEQVCARTNEGCINENTEEEDLFSLNEDQLNLDRLTLSYLTEMKSSTPEPKPAQSYVKDKTSSQTSKERGRKGRADGMNVSLKKPWENSRPRTRSKSRERGANKQPVVKIKMDTSIGSSDAYDFFSEESVHLTPFRQSKENNESKMEENKQSCSEQSSSENESDDSLYVPHSKNPKRQNIENKLNSGSPPSRPRSKRTAVLQKQQQQQQLLGEKEQKKAKSKEESGNSTSNEKKDGKAVDLKIKLGNAPIDTGSDISQIKLETGNTLKAPHAQHFGLCDITNFSAVSSQKEIRKISCPLLDCDQEKSGTPLRKRRCTFTVNYKEPTLSGKLRRGDPFTDTEFLHSPIFKEKNSKSKSYKQRSFTRYNEAFVGCR